MNETERDPALDAAWREASREEPPAALDDTIRAAARREVQAAPRRTRDKHWWYPVAAAATVAVIAIGLLQLTPPEQVAPVVVAEKDTAADTGAQTAQREAPGAPAARRDATEPAAPVRRRDADVPSPPPAAQAQNAAPSGSSRAVPAGKTALEEQRSPSAGSSAGLLEAKPQSKTEPSYADKLARSEPFPAAPAASAPPAAAPAPPRDAAATGERQLRTQAALAKDASGELAKSKQAPARSVDDWIKLIRDLRVSGKLAEATKELAAFREAYGERADSLLPADLRDLKPQEPAAVAK